MVKGYNAPGAGMLGKRGGKSLTIKPDGMIKEKIAGTCPIYVVKFQPDAQGDSV